MQTSPCKFLSLPEDVLVDIICACSVEDVVRLGRTCKYMREVCFLRPIWLSLLQDLDVTQAPDISAYQMLDTLSTEELYRKAITAVRNSRAWRTRGALRLVQDVSIKIDPRSFVDPDGELVPELTERIDPRLIPGARHALLENHGRLELWSLFPRARVWTATPSRAADCISFDFEVVDGGEALMIAALFLNVVSGCFVQVYKFKFGSWEDQLLTEYNLPMAFFFRLMIRGDLVMIHMPHSVQLTLLNWKTGSVLLLNFTNSEGRRTNARAALIADQHIIIVMHLGALTLIAIPLASLQAHWSNGRVENEGMDITFTHSTLSNPDPVPQPDTDIDAPTRPNFALRLRLADPPMDEEEEPYILALHAFTPLWQRNAVNGDDILTEIYVVAYDNLKNKSKKSLLSYRVQLMRVERKCADAGLVEEGEWAVRGVENGTWRLRLVQQTRAPASKLPWNSGSISNAGTMFSLAGEFNCYTLFSSIPQPTNVLPIFPDIIPKNVEAEMTVMSVEPTSGALAIGTAGLVRVLRIN